MRAAGRGAREGGGWRGPRWRHRGTVHACARCFGGLHASRGYGVRRVGTPRLGRFVRSGTWCGTGGSIIARRARRCGLASGVRRSAGGLFAAIDWGDGRRFGKLLRWRVRAPKEHASTL